MPHRPPLDLPDPPPEFLRLPLTTAYRPPRVTLWQRLVRLLRRGTQR